MQNNFGKEYGSRLYFDLKCRCMLAGIAMQCSFTALIPTETQAGRVHQEPADIAVPNTPEAGTERHGAEPL